jgi:protein TonB
MLQLFENELIGSIGKTARVRSAFWSLLIHGTAFLFILSLGFSPVVQMLPDPVNLVYLMAPPAPPPPPLPPAKTATARVRKTVRAFTATLTAPVSIPKDAPVFDTIAEAPADIGVVGGLPGSIPGGVLGGVLGGIPSTIELPPPPPAPPQVVKAALLPKPPPPPRRIQVTSDVQEAKLLQMVQPQFPRQAREYRVTGSVHLSAVIDRDGNIVEVRVLNGPTLLVAAAREAVEKWHYRPTFLDGEAVEVTTEIVVNFRLM